MGNRGNRDKIDTVNTHIHDNSLSLLDAGTSIKRGGVQPVSPPPGGNNIVEVFES
jgi:hypothetical protein